MANVLVKPARLKGTIPGIPSKSSLHRLLICAALADTPTELCYDPSSLSSEDIKATASCMEVLGAELEFNEGSILVAPIKDVPSDPSLFCKESGSTLRFLLPVASALCGRCQFTGAGKLPQRPITELLQAMEAHGVSYEVAKEGAFLPLTTNGRLQPGQFTLPGNVSSQYITGLLLALPRLDGDSSIVLTTALESAEYINITLQALHSFGVVVEPTDTGWHIPGKQTFRSPGMVQVDADWSNAAFWMVANELGASVSVSGMNLASPQGDKQILRLLEQWDFLSDIDLRQIPDLLPILAILAMRSGRSIRFSHGERLRIKESDRLHTVYETVRALGGQIEEQPDGLLVQGFTAVPEQDEPVVIDGYNDHRIVMAAAIAACTFGPRAGVLIKGAEAVNKSYPNFFTHLTELGGTLYDI